MRLYLGKVAYLAKEIVEALMNAGRIEVEPQEIGEVQLDVESVLKEYIRMDREITDKARDVIARHKRDHSDLKKIKAQLARDRGFAVDEEAIEYVIGQIIQALIHSNHVVEVYGADNELAVVMAPILRKYMAADEELDQEVRRRIRNLTEGTLAWDVQYQKVMEELRRTKKLN